MFFAVCALAFACGPDEGSSRELLVKWQNDLVRAQGQEVYSDGEWRKDGRLTFFYDDGKKEAEGDYELGRETGHWSHWLDDGTRAEGSYREGKRIGAWTYWHENGKKQEEGEYATGQRIGRWTWLYSSGKRREISEYSNGKVHGVRIAFKEDGSIDDSSCGAYSEGVRSGPLPAGFDVAAWLAQ